ALIPSPDFWVAFDCPTRRLQVPEYLPCMCPLGRITDAVEIEPPFGDPDAACTLHSRNGAANVELRRRLECHSQNLWLRRRGCPRRWCHFVCGLTDRFLLLRLGPCRRLTGLLLLSRFGRGCSPTGLLLLLCLRRGCSLTGLLLLLCLRRGYSLTISLLLLR